LAFFRDERSHTSIPNQTSSDTQAKFRALTAAGLGYRVYTQKQHELITYHICGDKLRCQISGETFSKEVVIAAHLLPARMSNSSVLLGLLGLTKDDIYSSRNCLFMHESLERAFDEGKFSIVPKRANPTQPIYFEVEVHAPNHELKHLGHTLARYNGRRVTFDKWFVV